MATRTSMLSTNNIAKDIRKAPEAYHSLKGEWVCFGGLLEYLSSILFFFLHITSAGSFPKALTAAEEKKYLEQMAAGDHHARQKLIEHNLRLVAHIAKKYYADENDRDDLVSIGTVGLIKAVDSFDPTKGIRLSSATLRGALKMRF